MSTMSWCLDREIPRIKTKVMNPSHLWTLAQECQPVNAFHIANAKKCHTRHISDAQPHDLATWQKLRTKTLCIWLLSNTLHIWLLSNTLHIRLLSNTLNIWLLSNTLNIWLLSTIHCTRLLSHSLCTWLRHSTNDSVPSSPHSPVLVMCDHFQRLCWCFDDIITRKGFPVKAKLLHSRGVFQRKPLWREQCGLDTKFVQTYRKDTVQKHVHLTSKMLVSYLKL